MRPAEPSAQSSRVSCVVNYYGPTDFTKSYGKSVDAAAGRVLAELMDHVSDIVQQAGEHGGGRRVVRFGMRRALQGVLQLVDAAQAVPLGGAADEDVEKFLAQIAHTPFLARTGVSRSP